MSKHFNKQFLKSDLSELESILSELVRVPSITPLDNGCQTYIANYLQSIGFTCQFFNNDPVTNLYAQFGKKNPRLLLAGHTDVVPTGPESQWDFPPFTLTKKNGYYYGRGVADMKGSLAAMMLAAHHFVTNYPHNEGLAFLITSAEEGDDYLKGTPYVMEQLIKNNISPDYCIVGEPSSQNTIGDTLKIGRRGSLTGKLHIQGKQGHVAYPHLALNPIHQFAPALAELAAKEWDKGNQHFPPSTLQITHIHAGGEANNIIPGELVVHFNIRFSTEQSAETLQNQIHNILDKHEIRHDIRWQLSGKPFLTPERHLVKTCCQVIESCTGKKTELSTSGGTSDARFIAPYGIDVVELGPVNASIHQINECLQCNDLNQLCNIYLQIYEKLLL